MPPPPVIEPKTDIGLWQEFLARFGLTLEQIDKNPPVYVIRGKKVGDGLGQGPVFLDFHESGALDCIYGAE